MEKKDVVKKRNPENCMQNSAASLPHAPSSVFPTHAAGKKRKPCLRKILAFWILMAVLGGAGGWIYQTWQKIPSSIRIRAGAERRDSGQFEQTADRAGESDSGLHDGCKAVWNRAV